MKKKSFKVYENNFKESIYGRGERKNAKKHGARETRYAKRDIQSGITF